MENCIDAGNERLDEPTVADRPCDILKARVVEQADPRASGPKLWIMVACLPALTAQA